jgi:hypothetical protein
VNDLSKGRRWGGEKEATSGRGAPFLGGGTEKELVWDLISHGSLGDAKEGEALGFRPVLGWGGKGWSRG